MSEIKIFKKAPMIYTKDMEWARNVVRQPGLIAVLPEDAVLVDMDEQQRLEAEEKAEIFEDTLKEVRAILKTPEGDSIITHAKGVMESRDEMKRIIDEQMQSALRILKDLAPEDVVDGPLPGCPEGDKCRGRKWHSEAGC